jgi:hypothetical protein
MWRVQLTVLAVLTLAAYSGWAQEGKDSARVTPTVGSYVVPRFELPVLKDPPNFFGLTGPAVGNIKPNQPYMVVGEKYYPSLTGDRQKWLQVRPVSHQPHVASNEKQLNDVWVFYGSGGSPAGNLATCDVDTCAWSGTDLNEPTGSRPPVR